LAQVCMILHTRRKHNERETTFRQFVVDKFPR
jgi:hypothetical protein